MDDSPFDIGQTMRSPALRTLLESVVLPAFFLAATANGASGQAVISVATERLDSVFAGIGRAEPGCVVGAHRGNEAPIVRAYGLASVEHRVDIAPATRFHAASITKQLVAFAIGLLVSDGKASWDDDVHRFVPELPSYSGGPTLRQLASHTSGLRDPGDLFGLAGVRNDQAVSESENLAMIVRQKELNFRPGTQYQYSNANYSLLRLVVERISRSSFPDFAAQRILQPLGMTETLFQRSRWEVIPHRAFPYQRSGDGDWRLALPMWETIGPTGMLTTAGDLLRWVDNLSAKRLGDGVVNVVAVPQRLTDGSVLPYGLGVDVLEESGVRMIGHTGGDDGINTAAYRFPNADLSVVVLCNRSDGDAPGKLRGVANAFLGGALGVRTGTPPAITAAPVSSAHLASLSGIYRNPITNDIRKIELRNRHLVYARGAGSELVPLSEDRFRFAQTFTEVAFRLLDGRRYEMRVIPVGQPVARYVQEVPYSPSIKTLGQFAGRFFSPEIETFYRVEVGGGRLVVVGPGDETSEMDPAFRDAFVSGDFLVRFTRDASGRVNGLLVNQVRVRNLRFRRVATSSLENDGRPNTR